MCIRDRSMSVQLYRYTKEIIGILTAQDVIEAVDDEMGEDYRKNTAAESRFYFLSLSPIFYLLYFTLFPP